MSDGVLDMLDSKSGDGMIMLGERRGVRVKSETEGA
jgi:hypothetical protein